MSEGSLTHLMSKHVSVRTILTDLQNEIDDIDEIYVMARKKSSERYHEYMLGDYKGLAFAIFCFKKNLLNKLNAQDL